MTHPVPPEPAGGLPLTRRMPVARLGVVVVAELVKLIVTGKVAQGELLPPEGPLAEQFGVSRTIIRESVKRLEEKGLVTVAQGRGTRVTQFESWNVLDPVVMSALIDNEDPVDVLDELTVVRAFLESAMTGRVAARSAEVELDRLEEDLQRMRSLVDDVEAFYAADAAFHVTMMQLSGNRLATNIARSLYQRARESEVFRAGHPHAGVPPTLAEHEQIFEAVRAGDVAAAEERMRRHIEGGWARRRPR